MVTCKEVEFENYGKCLAITNDTMEVYVTVDLGPRIIKCNLLHHENLMFVDRERAVSQDVSEAFGNGATWFIYGGHRMWMSPENLPLTYYPDNDKVVYTVHPNGATFTPPLQKINHVQHEMKIEMEDENPKIKILHTLTNTGTETIKGAIWALSVMAPNGMALLPQPDVDTGLLGNRVLALWPYTDMNDVRAFFGKDYIALRQIPHCDKKWKCGINNTQGWLAYLHHDCALIKAYSPNHPDGVYPDFGVSTEIFTNGKFLEAETLSELTEIESESTITHTEVWNLIDAIKKPIFENNSINAVGDQIKKMKEEIL